MSWSPDSQWLCYTVVAGPEADLLQPGWLFETSRDRWESRAPAGLVSRRVPDPAPVYRIWASRQDDRSSVLIEESRWPLTTASWSPRGRSVAFGRFVPQSIEPDQAGQHGRFEVVVQNGLDRKDVVWTSSDFELDAETRASFGHLVCAWSPDGLYLAIPRPGRQPSIMIVRTDTKKQLHILDHAMLPAWSPDGSKCAFVRRETGHNNLEVVERRGQSFGAARKVVTTGPVTATPFWSNDGRSILAVIERPTSRSPELELSRCVLDLDTTVVTRVLSLAPDPVRRAAIVRGVAIDFDREAERCFFSVDLVGRDSDLVWSIPRDHETHKRYNPLDVSQRIGALAVSPDGRSVAVRFGMPGALSPPALTDYEMEQTSLIVPDATSRKEWITVLADTAAHLLVAELPPAAVDGRAVERPTLLPLPGEITALDVVNSRLIRIATLGSSLCSPPADGPGAAPRAVDSSEIEARLFFNYLRGDFRAAAADLESLDPYVSDLDHRLSLLSVRAQILWSEGQKTEARDVIAYLHSIAGANTQRIEETPLGLATTTDVSPSQAWARYLSMRAALAPEAQTRPGHDPAGEFADPHPQDPFDALELRGFEAGRVGFPFAPAFRGRAGQGGENAALPNGRAPLPRRHAEPRF
ncbi:MAG: TolB family protein [Isosphaerales bacterium]